MIEFDYLCQQLLLTVLLVPANVVVVAICGFKDQSILTKDTKVTQIWLIVNSSQYGTDWVRFDPNVSEVEQPVVKD